jgi:hypothetical protein
MPPLFIPKSPSLEIPVESPAFALSAEAKERPTREAAGQRLFLGEKIRFPRRESRLTLGAANMIKVDVTQFGRRDFVATVRTGRRE